MNLTLENTMIRPAEELGRVLTGRAAAATLRARVEDELARDSSVEVDFEGVMLISPSFADELFAKLPLEAVNSGRVKFLNLDEEHLALVRFVAAGRQQH